jgi:hypothetical protein
MQPSPTPIEFDLSAFLHNTPSLRVYLTGAAVGLVFALVTIALRRSKHLMLRVLCWLASGLAVMIYLSHTYSLFRFGIGWPASAGEDAAIFYSDPTDIVFFVAWYSLSLLLILAVEEGRKKLRKQENQQLLVKLNKAYTDAPDADEAEHLRRMRSAQRRIVE